MSEAKSTGTRLNESIRRHVMESFHDEMVAKRVPPLVKRQRRLVLKVYNEVMPTHIRRFANRNPDYFDRINHLDWAQILDKYLPHDAHPIGEDGREDFCSRGGNVIMFPDGKARPWPHHFNYRNWRNTEKMVFIPSDKLVAEATGLYEAIKAYRSARHKAMCNIQALLQSVTTVNKLLSVWPEVKDHLPEVDRSAALVVTSKEVNRSIAEVLLGKS